jgi:hypothetical protein
VGHITKSRRRSKQLARCLTFVLATEPRARVGAGAVLMSFDWHLSARRSRHPTSSRISDSRSGMSTMTSWPDGTA